MEDVNAVFSGLNTTVALCIAGAVAFLFIFFVLYDSFRNRRKASRLSRRSRSTPRAGLFSNLRLLRESMDSEMSRRRHRQEREREWDKKL